VPPRLAFLQTRLAQQQISNVTPVRACDLSALPFASGSFDLITLVEQESPVLNGSAAWRAAAGTAHTLLKGGGWFCLAVENRLGFQRVLRRGRSQSARPTHTLQGYRRLLMRAGFSAVEAFAPLPFYDRIPLFYLPMAPGPALPFFFRSIFPLFEAVSPEVKRTYAREYAAARAAVRLAQCCRWERLITWFLSGFILLARRNGSEARAA
jgi:hypothetical protein